MKKVLGLLVFVCLFFSGCTQFKDGGGWVFGEGLWIIPLIMFLGAGVLIYDAYRNSKSGSTQQTPGGQVEGPSMPFWSWKNYRLLIGAAIIVAMIYVIINVISNR